LNNNYIDGTINLTDIVLMSKAEAKHEELCEDDAFEIANKKDDVIMALQTQVDGGLVYRAYDQEEVERRWKILREGNVEEGSRLDEQGPQEW